jgi:hypothetical protein
MMVTYRSGRDTNLSRPSDGARKINDLHAPNDDIKLRVAV